MITKRIIPCLDVRDGRVVKGVNFEGLQDVSSPVTLAKYYSDCGADELVFYDITASSDGRKLSEQFSMRIIASGGVSSMEDVQRLAAMEIHGAIIGKAYYTGAVNLKGAIEVAK